MSNTVKITISGGFHNAGQIVIRAKVDPRGGVKLSHGQCKRINAHMCGVKGCICGMHHGWQIDGVDRGDLSEAFNDANAKHFINSERNI